jgi:hypothetical protein
MLDAFKNQPPSSARAAATTGAARIEDREKTAGRHTNRRETPTDRCSSVLANSPVLSPFNPPIPPFAAPAMSLSRPADILIPMLHPFRMRLSFAR